MHIRVHGRSKLPFAGSSVVRSERPPAPPAAWRDRLFYNIVWDHRRPTAPISGALHVAGPQAIEIEFPGGHRRGVTPVPIPNTEVKLSTADGTAWETAWESRSLPGLFFKGPSRKRRAFFLVPSRLVQPRTDEPARLREPLLHRNRHHPKVVAQRRQPIVAAM
jgi:hypothetical protein